MSKLFDSYKIDPSRYNEMFAADGAIHPHWQHFADTLSGMTAEQMQQRADLVTQQIHENGVTYNVYADPSGNNRPWRLGPIPNLIPMDEWKTLAEGVAQRASLLNDMLVDIYGKQTLIQQGFLHAELI